MVLPVSELLLPGLASLTPFPGTIFSPEWRGRYPHMMPLDIAIWDRFLDKFGEEFEGFQYDVTLGEGALAPSHFSEEDKRLLWLSTVKRADALGIRRNKLVLFEVKPRLGMAAVGQCVSYLILWQRQYANVPPVEMAWVGEMAEPDLFFVMSTLGFRSVVT